jgi:hypothetical protein
MDAAPTRGPFRRLVASRRRRRRSLGAVSLLVVAAGAASLVVWVGDTGRDEPATRPGPSQVYRPEVGFEPSDAELSRIHDVAVHWIETAVRREHVGESWALTHPELRRGFTRAQWSTGSIPAVPYPAAAPQRSTTRPS